MSISSKQAVSGLVGLAVLAGGGYLYRDDEVSRAANEALLNAQSEANATLTAMGQANRSGVVTTTTGKKVFVEVTPIYQTGCVAKTAFRAVSGGAVEGSLGERIPTVVSDFTLYNLFGSIVVFQRSEPLISCPDQTGMVPGQG